MDDIEMTAVRSAFESKGIAEMVENRTLDPENIYFWGSPLFLE